MRLAAIGLTLTLVLAATGSLRADKPDSTPNWRCRVTFRDASDDKIQSDGAGPYVDGIGGVRCYIYNDPGGVRDGWLYMVIERVRNKPPARFVRYVTQTFEGATYPDFLNHGSFEVKGLARVPWNPVGLSPRDVMPFRAWLQHPQLPFDEGFAAFDGDSNVVGTFGYDGTSSVFVQPVDACSWQVTSYTSEEPDLFVGASGERATRTVPRVMRLRQGVTNASDVGDFPMAFQATVRIIANKAGCSLP